MPILVNKVLLDHSQKKKKKKVAELRPCANINHQLVRTIGLGYVNNNKDFQDAGIPS